MGDAKFRARCAYKKRIKFIHSMNAFAELIVYPQAAKENAFSLKLDVTELENAIAVLLSKLN